MNSDTELLIDYINNDDDAYQYFGLGDPESLTVERLAEQLADEYDPNEPAQVTGFARYVYESWYHGVDFNRVAATLLDR